MATITIPDSSVETFPVIGYSFCHPRQVLVREKGPKLLQWQHLVGGEPQNLDLVVTTIQSESLDFTDSTDGPQVCLQILKDHHMIESLENVTKLCRLHGLQLTYSRDGLIAARWITRRGFTAFQVQLKSPASLQRLLVILNQCDCRMVDSNIGSRALKSQSHSGRSTRSSLASYQRVKFVPTIDPTGRNNFKQVFSSGTGIHLNVLRFSRACSNPGQGTTWEHVGLTSGLTLSLIPTQPIKLALSHHRYDVMTVKVRPDLIAACFARSLLSLQVRDLRQDLILQVQFKLSTQDVSLAVQWFKWQGIKNITPLSELKTGSTHSTSEWSWHCPA